MEMTRLIECLSDPAAYPNKVGAIDICHTHVSVVFLAGPFAYKVKKPVELGFLDFSTLEKRRHFCEEEVRLNRRLAPHVYLGVVPITRADAGLAVEGDGEAVEWAVKMERLPDEATLEKRLRAGKVGTETLEALARKVSSFHAAAESGGHVAAFGRFDVVAGNARENFEQSAAHIGTTLSPAVFERLRARTEEALQRLRPRIETRAARGVPRDTHGDLHLDHVYLFPDRPPPNDLVIIDCIEFNERFRYADPVADMAFLFMDLVFQGRRDLAQVFADEYFRASQDDEGRALLPFYAAYRAAVRGKVDGFELAEKEVPEAERAAAQGRARAHWLLALGELEEPARKPCLVLVGGLPGTGKSTLARGLAAAAGFEVLRSDVVRKELANVSGPLPPRITFEEGIYLPEWDDRTYAECLRRAKSLLFEGKRVLVDASFREDKRRRAFFETARRWGVPGVLFLCRAGPEVVRRRIESRKGDASDADWFTYLQAATRWEESGNDVRRALHEIDTDGEPEGPRQRALEVLRAAGLAG
jgi:aminoglycoside phosphotransferase family enzyme/predicted kinase